MIPFSDYNLFELNGGKHFDKKDSPFFVIFVMLSDSAEEGSCSLLKQFLCSIYNTENFIENCHSVVHVQYISNAAQYHPGTVSPRHNITPAQYHPVMKNNPVDCIIVWTYFQLSGIYCTDLVIYH